MPTESKAMSVNYKTIRCRFFYDNGQPRQPSCPLGSRCNFIHPGDARWNKGKKPSQPDVYRPSTSIMPSAQRKRHQSPLPPQHDLFLSCNPGIVDEPNKSPQSERYINEGLEGRSTQGAPRDRAMKSNRPSEGESSKRAVKVEPSELSPLLKATHVVNQSTTASTMSHVIEREKKLRADKASQLFRTFAKLSSQVAQNTFNCDQEEKKLRKYSEISSQLSAISPSVTSAVTETLSDIITKHAHFKQLVEKDVKAQVDVWEELQNLLISSGTAAFDRILGDMKAKAQRICDDMLSQTTSTLKRRISDTSQSSSNPRMLSHSDRESKRRSEPDPIHALHKSGYDSRQRKRQRIGSYDELAAMEQQMAELRAENSKLRDTIAGMSASSLALAPSTSAIDTSITMIPSSVAESSSAGTVVAVEDTPTELQAPAWPSFSTAQMEFLRRLLDEHLPTQLNAD